MKKKFIVKIEILKCQSLDREGFEVYLDGNRLEEIVEMKVIRAVEEYLEKNLKKGRRSARDPITGS